MLETIQQSTSDGLAYEQHGDRVPVVFLHGLTLTAPRGGRSSSDSGKTCAASRLTCPATARRAANPALCARPPRGSTPRSRARGSMSR